MRLFKDETFDKRAKHLTTLVKVSDLWEFVHDEVGYNYRMPNINAALCLAQLEQLGSLIQIKRYIANVYGQFFKEIGVELAINLLIPDPTIG